LAPQIKIFSRPEGFTLEHLDKLQLFSFKAQTQPSLNPGNEPKGSI